MQLPTVPTSAMSDGAPRSSTKGQTQQPLFSPLGLYNSYGTPSHSSSGNLQRHQARSSTAKTSSSSSTSSLGSSVLSPPTKEPLPPFSFFPPHHTQLHPRYNPQVAAALAAAAARRRRQALLCCLFLGATVCTLLYCAMCVPAGLSLAAAEGMELRGRPSQSPMVLAGLQPEWVSYVVIIDAGSSGSRVHVVPFQGSGNASVLPAILPQKMSSLKIRPGLSTLEHAPGAAGRSLEPLLEFAKMKVRGSARREELQGWEFGDPRAIYLAVGSWCRSRSR